MRIFNAFRTYGLASDPAEDWRKRAACRDENPETFFPYGSGVFAERREQQALQICNSCPVRSQCRQWAVDHGVTDGIWGMPEATLKRLVAIAGTAKHRAASRIGTCANGHSRTGNTRVDKQGHRDCMACARERKAVTSC